MSVVFPEDSGPLAHPIRPDSFQEISNFYTATVYNKGAEVIRMMRTMAGKERFRKGTDLYFERHDGLLLLGRRRHCALRMNAGGIHRLMSQVEHQIARVRGEGDLLGAGLRRRFAALPHQGAEKRQIGGG